MSDKTNEQPVNGSAPAEATPPPSREEELEKELKDQQNKYLYLYADFENYKKRSIKERSDFLKFGHESFIRELLQVSDNLERALSHADSNSSKELEALKTGIQMVDQQLKDILTKFGVTTVRAVGTKFDPTLHEAVEQEKADAEEGSVTREHQKGYLLHGRLLRPARVTIATK